MFGQFNWVGMKERKNRLRSGRRLMLTMSMKSFLVTSKPQVNYYEVATKPKTHLSEENIYQFGGMESDYWKPHRTDLASFHYCMYWCIFFAEKIY